MPVPPTPTPGTNKAYTSLELLRPGLADPLDRVEVFSGDESPQIELLRLREDFR